MSTSSTKFQTKVVTCPEKLLQLCKKKNLDGQGADEQVFQERLHYWDCIAERWTKDGIIQKEPLYQTCPYCSNPDDRKCGHRHLSREEINRLLSSDYW